MQEPIFTTCTGKAETRISRIGKLDTNFTNFHEVLRIRRFRLQQNAFNPPLTARR
jgi:hypothetical protein